MILELNVQNHFFYCIFLWYFRALVHAAWAKKRSIRWWWWWWWWPMTRYRSNARVWFHRSRAIYRTSSHVGVNQLLSRSFFPLPSSSHRAHAHTHAHRHTHTHTQLLSCSPLWLKNAFTHTHPSTHSHERPSTLHQHTHTHTHTHVLTHMPTHSRTTFEWELDAAHWNPEWGKISDSNLGVKYCDGNAIIKDADGVCNRSFPIYLMQKMDSCKTSTCGKKIVPEKWNRNFQLGKLNWVLQL